MRVISGQLKGRRFPPKLPPGVRPTLDAARETVFNIISNEIDFEGAPALDIFAGAGAMGIEALSRGAGKSVFIDKSYKSGAYIKKALNEFGIHKSRWEILIEDAEKAVGKLSAAGDVEKFGLVFIDPPYAAKLNNQIINNIASAGLVAENGIVVSESGPLAAVDIPPGFEKIREKSFGASKIILLIFTGNDM